MKVDRGKKKLKANRLGENGNLESGKAPAIVRFQSFLSARSVRGNCKESQVKAPVVNALGGGFDLEDVDIAGPIGREVLVNVHDGYAALEDGSFTRVVVTSF
jgi:hypothetical protein